MNYLKSLVFVVVTVLASCSSSKQTAVAPAVDSSRKVVENLEGQKVISETATHYGIEMADALNEDGTAMVKRPFKWFAGTGKADNKQVAIELAQREAYATISRVLNNAVKDEAERGNVVPNGRVQQALTTHWEQVSASLQRGCEPFGNTTIEYNPATGMYEATAKIAIRGDRFNQMLNTAGSFKPTDLSGTELDDFIAKNKAIMEAARGK